jgi:prevent-host-death family protein
MLKPLIDIPAAEAARNFAKVSDQALREPVRITSHGRPRLVLLSVEEYERLKRRDRVVVKIEDLPDEFFEALMATEPSAEAEQFNHELDDPAAS